MASPSMPLPVSVRGHRLQLLLPTEQNTRRNPMAPRHLGEARARLRRLLNDLAFLRRTCADDLVVPAEWRGPIPASRKSYD
jgi:hypothetical protein